MWIECMPSFFLMLQLLIPHHLLAFILFFSTFQYSSTAFLLQNLLLSVLHAHIRKNIRKYC